jgi:cation diffusion facilitator CzcD-associated flavoprotein CzcO
VLKRCRFNACVVGIERESELGPWRIIVRPTDDPDAGVGALRCDKLVVSAGHETLPNFPSDLDLSKFTGSVFHSK